MEEKKIEAKDSSQAMIARAEAAAERMEAANKVTAELVERQERLRAVEILSGTTDAGDTPKEETEDEKWAREAKIRYAGTGMDPTN